MIYNYPYKGYEGKIIMLTDKEFISYVCSDTTEKRALLASTSEQYKQQSPFYTGIQGSIIDELPAANIFHNVDTIRQNMTLYLNYKPTHRNRQ